MKIWRSFFLVFWFPFMAFSQQSSDILTGNVTYVTSKNVYVRFTNTDAINPGDTLYWEDDLKVKNVLIVRQKSSTSCVTEPLRGSFPLPGQNVVFVLPVKPAPPLPNPAPEIITEHPVSPAVTLDQDSISSGAIQNGGLKKQTINGRVTLSTNASIQSGQADNFQRIRASAALSIFNINQSDFSVQSYITYRHRYGVDQSTTDFYDDFKVLALAVQWQPSAAFQLWLGRRNNPNMANLGAIDGAQIEWRKGKFTLGTFLGTRPDFSDFTFNARLPQAGVYIARIDQWKGKQAQTSLALAEQQNDFKTDRRFIYFQHSNQILKNLNFFLSSELELYKKINGEVSTKPSLTSFYVSLRYRMFKSLSFTGSYDNRRNVIYYESYQTYIDQFLAQETRQGLRFQMQWNVWKKIQLFGTAFYRFQGDKPNPTKNYIGAVNFNRLMGNRINLNLSFNHLESYYFSGNIMGGKISDQFFKGKMQLELQYRNINYNFYSTESILRQHITGVNINLLWFKNTSVVLSYENTYEPSRVWHRYFVTISQRIKQ